MRTIRIAAIAVLGLILALALFGAGHAAIADTQAAPNATPTPMGSSTSGTNPRVTIPVTGDGGTSSNSTHGLSRLPSTGGSGGAGTSILPSVLLALLGICAVIAGRAVRNSRR
jgi:hypothetical protein